MGVLDPLGSRACNDRFSNRIFAQPRWRMVQRAPVPSVLVPQSA